MEQQIFDGLFTTNEVESQPVQSYKNLSIQEMIDLTLLDPSYIRVDDFHRIVFYNEDSPTATMAGRHETLDRVFEGYLGAWLWYHFFRNFWILDRMPWESRVLDIGCGYSLAARMYYLARRAMKFYVGIDGIIPVDIEFDVPTLDTSSKKRSLTSIGAKSILYVQKDFSDGIMPLKSDTFDTIVAAEVLEHLTESAGMTLVNEIHRILAPGGTVIMTTPLSDYLSSHDEPGHINVWNYDDLSKFLDSSPLQKKEFFTCSPLTRSDVKSLVQSNPVIALLQKRLPSKIFRSLMYYVSDLVSADLKRFVACIVLTKED